MFLVRYHKSRACVNTHVYFQLAILLTISSVNSKAKCKLFRFNEVVVKLVFGHIREKNKNTGFKGDR